MQNGKRLVPFIPVEYTLLSISSLHRGDPRGLQGGLPPDGEPVPRGAPPDTPSQRVLTLAFRAAGFALKGFRIPSTAEELAAETRIASSRP